MEQVVVYMLMGLFGLLFLNYFNKYKKIKTSVGDLLKEFNKPLRKGYYKEECAQTSKTGDIVDYEAFIYVNELKRYTNGDSKLELEKVEIISNINFNRKPSEEFINENFSSLVKTSLITWLEEEPDIKTNRKEKLKILSKIFKNV